MILVEWFTNSHKYGACSVPEGKVKVAWQRLDDPRGWVRLTWTERDGPLIRRAGKPSLGTKLVQGFAGNELRGRCHMTYPPEGAEHVLEFPGA